MINPPNKPASKRQWIGNAVSLLLPIFVPNRVKSCSRNERLLVNRITTSPPSFALKRIMPICRKIGNWLFEKPRWLSSFCSFYQPNETPKTPYLAHLWTIFVAPNRKESTGPEIIKSSNVDEWIFFVSPRVVASNFRELPFFNRRSSSYWELNAMGIKIKVKRKKDKSQSPNISAALISFVPTPSPCRRHTPGI